MKALGVLVLAMPLAAMTADAPTRPSVPYVSRGACPGECCEYGNVWTAKQDTEVQVAPRLKSPVAFLIRKGDKVLAVTGMVVTTKLGRAVVRKPTQLGVELKREAGPSDDVFVLYDRGEGAWRIWFRGRQDDQELPTEAEECATEGGRPIQCEVQIGVRPETVWWSKVRGRDGREGWTRKMKHFTGVYGCGE